VYVDGPYVNIVIGLVAATPSNTGHKALFLRNRREKLLLDLINVDSGHLRDNSDVLVRLQKQDHV
jgi:hypothetical protein